MIDDHQSEIYEHYVDCNGHFTTSTLSCHFPLSRYILSLIKQSSYAQARY